MQEVSILPNRVRFRNSSLLYNKELAKYINVYIDNLYGVKFCSVNYITASILVIYDPMKTNLQVVRKNIMQAVSSAIKNKPENIREYDIYYRLLEKRDRAKRNMVLYGLVFVGLKIKNSLFGKFFLSTNAKYLQAAAAVTIIGGYPLLKNLYCKLVKKIPADSDILLSLAALTFTITRESSKGVLVLMLKSTNDFIKYASEAECQRLLNQSMSRTSGMAWLITSSNQELLISTDELAVNDIIVLHEGETASVQGVIMEGSALVNTLYYNGQSVISRVDNKSRIYPGMSVISGSVKLKVEKIPEEFNMSQYDDKNTEIHQRVTRYQNLITPVSLVVGGLSYLRSGNIMNALAVMLSLSPSAAKTAVSSGMKSYIALLNKNRIFTRRPENLEKVVRIDHVVFDKTGTLTHGRMNLVDIRSFGSNYRKKELLKICTACESKHYHPISITLQQEYKDNPDIRKVGDSVLIPSKGVKANYENHVVMIGSKDFMEENHIYLEDKLEQYLECENRYCTPVMIAIDGKLTGMMAFTDTIKEGSEKLVTWLRANNSCNVSLLTGDNQRKAMVTAQKLGIPHVFSNCSYEKKAEMIRKYRQMDTVMMVGDGMNDVEAMRAADVSVSYANTSSDLVKLNSDYIIFEDRMERVVDTISLSRKAYQRINQTITFSQVYNLFFGWLAFTGTIDAFAAKNFNTMNSLMVLFLNKRIEYLSPVRKSAYRLGMGRIDSGAIHMDDTRYSLPVIDTYK